MTTITTGTTGPKAWKIALVGAAVGLATLAIANLPQTTSEESPATVRTPVAKQAPTGLSGPLPEYAVVSDQATIDRLAPVVTQEFLDGPSSADQGATRVDPRAAAAVGLDPGAIDAIVGGTTQVAPPSDDLADPQARATSTQFVPATSLAASDELLVNPVPEFTVEQLMERFRASERATP